MAQYGLADGIAELFNSERFSDLIIRCDDRKWYAHKAVVCMQSEFFKKACEGEIKEASSGYVDLDDDDPVVVDALLMYLYTGDYSDRIQEGDNRSTAVLNVQVFGLAEKFFVNPLVHAAARKFDSIASEYGDGEDFADAIEEWSHSTIDNHRILGNRILNIIVDHRSDIFDPNLPWTRIRDLVGAIPWLAAQTAQMPSLRLDLNISSNLYRCPSNKCKHTFLASITSGTQFRFTCPSCNKVSKMNLTSWDRFRISVSVVGPADEGEEMAEGDDG